MNTMARHRARLASALVAGAAGALPAIAQPAQADQPAAATSDWAALEAPILSNHRQLTTADDFTRAGEAYFDPKTDWVIFQAVPLPPPGERPSRHYSMYLAGVMRDGEGRVTGLVDALPISEPGSANTCGWFHPTREGVVTFSSTIEPPSADNVPGYQRGTGRYRWAFPSEMDIYAGSPEQVIKTPEGLRAMGFQGPNPVVTRPGYDAESSLSSDGRYLLYVHVDEQRSEALGRPDGNIWIRDQKLGRDVGIIGAEGYDGGPFFSPDDRWICYRSDREGNNLLQLFIAEIAYDDETGDVLGIHREIQLTDNRHVNWAPFWHPSGRILVYATSRVGHDNYEVFALHVRDAQGEPVTDAEPVRISHAAGFDGLPVFNADGTLMMWTSQRGPAAEGEPAGSSQLWLADVDTRALFQAVTGEPAPDGPWSRRDGPAEND